MGFVLTIYSTAALRSPCYAKLPHFPGVGTPKLTYPFESQYGSAEACQQLGSQTSIAKHCTKHSHSLCGCFLLTWASNWKQNSLESLAPSGLSHRESLWKNQKLNLDCLHSNLISKPIGHLFLLP